MNRIAIIDRYRQITISHKTLEKILNSLIKLAKISPQSTVSLVVVSAKTMEKLCAEHFKNKKITDVLAFPQEDLSDLTGVRELGEIFIAASVLKKQAKKYNHDTSREWAYLFAHAVLHLFGLDHTTPASEKKMHAMVETVLSEHGIMR